LRSSVHEPLTTLIDILNTYMLKGQPCLNTLMGERLYVNKYAEPVIILILMFT